MTAREKEEALRENERNFIEAYGSPVGPMKYLNKKQFNAIHA